MSQGVRLLRDIRLVFDKSQVKAIAPTQLVHTLAKIPESPWAGIFGAPGITARRVASLLADYEIQSQRNRDSRFYARRDFEDAWASYCPAPPPASVTTVTSDTPLQSKGNSVTDSAPVTLQSVTPPQSVPENLNEISAVPGVTVATDR